MNTRRLFAIVLKELRQLRRDRLTLGMVIGVPVLQLLLFGFAINLDVRNLPAAISDQSNTVASRALVHDMQATGVIDVVDRVQTPEQLVELIRRGRISVGIVLPHDFERRRLERREAIQILADDSDSVVMNVVRQLSQVPLEAGGSIAPARTATISVLGLYNPERRSAVNIVPALIGVILTLTMVLFTSVAIVRERERGNMELLITTPITRSELMIGKVLPYIALGLIQTTVVLLLGAYVFAVPVRGNVLDIYLVSLLLIAANLSLGLLISTGARSQFQAMQMTFFVFLPSILLSGFMFPFAGMPAFARGLAEVLPLTHFIRLIRGVMLRGADLSELWPAILALLAFTTVMMSVAILRFRKRLD